MKRWNKKHWFCFIAISLVVISACILLGNTNLEITEYYVTSSKIPDSFDGFEFAQISDLHNAEFGDENKDILELLSQDGMLVSDNILQEGDILESRYAIVRRDRTIHSRMREYIHTLTHTPGLRTVVLQVGDGMTLTLLEDENK